MFPPVVTLLLLFGTSTAGTISRRVQQYEEMRSAIVEAERGYGLGGKVFLSPEERRADRVLEEMKKREFNCSESGQLAAGMHFFDARPLIEKSAIFQALKLMPKGANLHVHNSAAVTSRWVIRNLTYRQEAKLCQKDDRYYFTVRPLAHCLENQTHRITVLRKENKGSIEGFDDWLESIINMKLKPSAKKDHSATVYELWQDFESCFDAMKGFLQYKPFFEAYHWQLLHEFHDDGLYYMELRISFAKVFDEQGKEYGPMEIADILSHIVTEFRRQHPAFHGVKLILAKHKNMNDEELENALKLYDTLSSTFPGFVIGFDLVGQEDSNRSLKSFAASLLQPPVRSGSASYFFHAGESVDHYTEADENLIDAILLNTRRIGHGYALLRHPILWHTVRRKQIVIEVCPISNQVLGLVRDLRNHPAGFYASQSIPITVASDDPGFWDAAGVSYDFYYAFMAIAPSGGLGFLKQLVWDSLKFSSISAEERLNITTTMEKEWTEFIKKLGKGNITENYNACEDQHSVNNS